MKRAIIGILVLIFSLIGFSKLADFDFNIDNLLKSAFADQPPAPNGVVR